jgi:glutamyl-tRNA reductase
MEFYCIGISHYTASLDVREKISCTQQEIGAALEYYMAHQDRYLGPSSEIALLSTCNRFEVYATFTGDNHPFMGKAEQVYRALEQFVVDLFGSEWSNLIALFVRYDNLVAVEHLFRVTAGLESQVLGETQILGQVSEALEKALRAGSARHTLASLFRSAIYSARRVHSETGIGKNPASISSVAATIAEKVSGNLTEQSILVIGAGEMSTLAVKAFHHRGAKNIVVVNRTLSHAGRLAALFGCAIRPWHDLVEVLHAVDIVVSSTRAQQPVITLKMIQEVMGQRQNRPLLLLDIALPRDVDPDVRDFAGVTLYDLDTIKERVNLTLQHRKQEVQQVEMILSEELQSFAHWMTVIPTVGKLHRKAEKIRRQEVDRMLQQFPELGSDVQEQIEHLSRSLVKKLLHDPSRKMRSQVRHGQHHLYASALHDLFALDEDDNQSAVE